MSRSVHAIFILCLLVGAEPVAAFSTWKLASPRNDCPNQVCYLLAKTSSINDSNAIIELPKRRQVIQSCILLGWNLVSSYPVKADLYEETTTKGYDDESLSAELLPLYYILRVREATEQESRLISSGQFKDVQRANVKLAVRFLLQNYKLSDNVIVSTAKLIADSSKRQAATEAGQRAVENLYTILEYFDSRDVENLKVGTYDSMAGKEPLVLKGLESARLNIDEFLTYFDARDVNLVRAKIQEENDLNSKEFDPSLGVILNPNPRK